MCGIAGYADFAKKTNPDVLGEMIGEIVYRGPDSSGEFFSKSKVAGMGIRRLSIIDLTTGDQPIGNETGSVWVVYNGEIYNFKDLRKKLESHGHKFSTKSDTEVLVHLYEEYGEDLSPHLNGMFAFSIWDERKQKLVLSRDRAGIKPLYYFRVGKTLVFGSEVKTILKHPLYNKQIDSKALSLYGYLGYFPGEFSIFKNIKKLLPGYTLTFSKSGLRIKKFFELDPEKLPKGQSLDNLLKNAVEMQLHADVPVGVFLSGGLDSSLIASYIAGVKKLKSFSIGFGEKEFDESTHAVRVAAKLGTDHYAAEFKQSDVVSLFAEVSKKLDEPLADASLLPTYKVSKMAKRYVKVVLSGDGGDELFGGYPTYQAGILADWVGFLPKAFFSLISNLLRYSPNVLVNAFPVSFKDYDKKELGRIVLSGLNLKNPQRHLFWMRSFFLGDKTLFGVPDLNFLNKSIIDLGKVKGSAKKSQVVDFYTYLRDDFLLKTDRASMYNSLEVRVPFLDNDVIDFAYANSSVNANLVQTKIMLRNLLQEKLPEVANRPKKGFGIPLKKWMKGKLKDFSYSALKNEKLYNYVDKKKVIEIWNEYQRGKQNYSGTIWMLIVLSGWLENFYKNK